MDKETLFKSRRWVWDNKEKTIGHAKMESPLYQLVCSLEDLCNRKGYKLSRWQGNERYNAHACVTTYAVHKGERTTQPRQMPESTLMISFKGYEGKSPRCIAYKALQKLYHKVWEL